MAYVPVQPFHARARQVGFDLVALRLDWLRPDGCPDGIRVQKTLGLVKDGKVYRQHVQEATAERLCEALDMLPREAGF